SGQQEQAEWPRRGTARHHRRAADGQIGAPEDVRVAGNTVHLDGLMVFPKGTQGLSRAPIGPDAIRQMKRSVAEQARSQGFSTVVLNYERHIPKPDGSIYKRPGSMTLDVAKILGD
ncbi:hypothetical protein, partial [Streptomyces sp. NPDC001274]